MNTFASGSTYKHEKLRTVVVCWVAGRRRLMAIIGDPEFLNIVKMLNPRAELPSQNTITRDIKTIYLMTRVSLRGSLKVHIRILSLADAVLT